jgi:hypothetical protein
VLPPDLRVAGEALEAGVRDRRVEVERLARDLPAPNGTQYSMGSARIPRRPGPGRVRPGAKFSRLVLEYVSKPLLISRRPAPRSVCRAHPPLVVQVVEALDVGVQDLELRQPAAARLGFGRIVVTECGRNSIE